MELGYSHAQGQRVLRQRNLLALATLLLGALVIVLFLIASSRDREIVLQPVLRSNLTVSSAGVSKDYLEMITRDVAVLTLNRSPRNLEYWMNEVLEITHPGSQGTVKGELLKILDEQRGSSISQTYTIQSMKVDPKALVSEVAGELQTIVGNRVISVENRRFRYTWDYTGLSLKLVGFGMVTDKPGEKS